jgi:hypothetical protein
MVSLVEAMNHAVTIRIYFGFYGFSWTNWITTYNWSAPPLN